MSTPFAYQMPVKPAEQISDGAVLVSNHLDKDIVLTSIEPLFLAGPRTDITDVDGTRVIALAQDPQDTGLGLQRVNPPRIAAGERLHDVAGLVIPPDQRRYALVISYRVRKGMAVVVGEKVEFTYEGREYVQVIEHHLQLCQKQSWSDKGCPPPSHI